MSEATRVHYRTCPLCEATCGLEVHTEGRRVVRVRGDADDVFSRGYVCPKGTQLGALYADPDRLSRPLVKRDGRHVEVDFDEAFREIEARLLPILEGNRSQVALYLGNPNVHNIAGSIYVRPLIQQLGTKNLYSASTVDQMPKHVSAGLMFGNPGTIPVPDIDRTQHLLMLGANPLESNGSLCTAPDFPGRLKSLRERGGRLVVVDPRRTRTAALADEHHAIRPGTDALLLVSLLQVLFAEERASLGDVADCVDGLAELESAVSPFTPERVAPHCGLAPEAIRSMALQLAEAPSAVVYGRIGTHTVDTGTLASWAADALSTVTGNLDRPGGAMFPLAAHASGEGRGRGRGFQIGRWKSRVREFPEVRGELPIATLADEIETPGEDSVRALVTVAGNPVLSAPEGERLDAAFAELDFMVSVDVYLNETTRHADVILPPASPLESPHYDLAFYGISVRNVANYSPPVFETSGPSESDLLARLALLVAGQGADADTSVLHDMMLRGLVESKVGREGAALAGRDVEEILSALEDRQGAEAMLDVMIRTGPYGDGFGQDPDGLSLEKLEANPHGIDLGPLQPRLPRALSTPSGKVELLPEPIREDLRRLEARLDESPREGLVLVGRRHLRSNNSWMHNVAPLMKGRDRCTLQIHPDDASRLGLEDGKPASIESRVGRITAPVELCDDIRPGVVSLPHGFGHDTEGASLTVAREHAGVNSNRITDGRPLDPLSGNAVLNGIPVEVAPA